MNELFVKRGISLKIEMIWLIVLVGTVVFCLVSGLQLVGRFTKSSSFFSREDNVSKQNEVSTQINNFFFYFPHRLVFLLLNLMVDRIWAPDSIGNGYQKFWDSMKFTSCLYVKEPFSVENRNDNRLKNSCLGNWKGHLRNALEKNTQTHTLVYP